jgi:hypothetical protein
MSAPSPISARRRPADGQRQSQGRDYQGLLSRADGQPDLRRHGPALRHCDPPGAPYKPRDKAKVEVGVQVVRRWILVRLRHQRFFWLAELNAAIRALLERCQ